MKPTWDRSRKGRPNRSSMTVRLAFQNMKFDAIREWVKAFQQLDAELLNAEEGELRFAILKEKMAKLEKVFEFIYPKITGMDINLTDILELEEAESGIKSVTPADKSTEELLKEAESANEDS